MSLPETVLQFGAGRFLRAFVDRFVHQANASGQAVGRVVVVQSTAGSRAETLRGEQGFHVLVRGIENGESVERVEPVQSVSRALVAAQAWNDVLTLAASPALRWITSNATESGYVLDPADRLDAAPAATLPGKLVQVLWRRFQAGAPPVLVLPCELIERNADKLLALVVEQSQRWLLPADFARWLVDDCTWLNTLVDCIVTRAPEDHPLVCDDPGAVCAEPYALWAIERRPGRSVPALEHPAVRLVDDLAPYYLRKVRILNGTHSAMVGQFGTTQFPTVIDVLRDRTALRWVRDLVYEEIVPTLAARVEGVAAFADDTFDRLRNPFLQHRLSDIALNHVDKVRVRLEPTRVEYLQLYGREPQRISAAIHGHAN